MALFPSTIDAWLGARRWTDEARSTLRRLAGNRLDTMGFAQLSPSYG
jgi:hypothetical protein